MEKLKIAFDPSDEAWDRGEFRKVIKSFIDDADKVELYVVGTVVSQGFIDEALEMGIDSANIYTEASDSAVVSRLDLLLVKIYLSADNVLIRNVNANSDDTVGILVNNIVDLFYNQMKYITWIQFWIKQIDRELNG